MPAVNRERKHNSNPMGKRKHWYVPCIAPALAALLLAGCGATVDLNEQATAETQQNGTEQNPTGQDPQFEIFCVPMEKSMDHADGQHTKGKQCQQEHGLSQQLIDSVALIQKIYHTGTVDLIEII